MIDLRHLEYCYGLGFSLSKALINWTVIFFLTLNCDIYVSQIKTSYLLITLSYFVVTICPKALKKKNVHKYYSFSFRQEKFWD